MEITNNTSFKRNKPKVINQEEWSKLISEWKSGTESQKEFCARLNLNMNTFTYIKGKLSAKDKQKKFIPLTIRQEACPKLKPNIILENTKGMKLHIPLTADEDMMGLLKLAGW